MENVVIKFVADTEGLKPAIDQLVLMGKLSAEDAKRIADMNEEQKEFLQTLKNTTNEADKFNNEIKEMAKTMIQDVFGKSIDELKEYIDNLGKGTNGVKGLKGELRELKKQIASGDFTGKELEQMTKRAAELEDHLGDVSQKIRALASDTKYIDAMVGAMRGVAAAASVAAGAAALFGSENEDLAKAAQRAQAAMALLVGIQEIATLVTSENATKTLFLDGAQKLAAASSKALGISITATEAAMTMGLSAIVAGIALIVTGFDDATTAADEAAKKISEANNEISASNLTVQQRIRVLQKKGFDRDLEQLKISNENELTEYDKKYRRQYLLAKSSKSLIDRLNKAAAESPMGGRGLTEEDKKREEQTLKFIDFYEKGRNNIIKKYNLERQDAVEENGKKELNTTKKVAEKKLEIARQSAFDILFAEAEAEAQRAGLMDDFTNKYMEMLHKEAQAEKDFDQEWLDNFGDMLNEKQDMSMDWWLRYFETEDKFNDEQDKKEKERAKERQQAAIDSAQNISNAIFEITNRDINARYDQEIAAIDERTAKVLENENLTAEQRKRIEAKAAADIAKIKTEQFKRQKQADIIQATINTALAVTRLLDNPIAAAAAGIAGAAQIAVIASQPIPKFAKGTEKFIAEGTGTADRGLAWLSHGERVVPTSVNNDYFDALSAIQNRQVDPTLANNIMMALSNGTMAAAQGDKLDVNKLVKALQGTNKQTTVNINIDEHGFMKFVQKGNSHREYVNKKFKYEA